MPARFFGDIVMRRKGIMQIRYLGMVILVSLCLFGIALEQTGNINPVDIWAWGTNVG